MKKTKTNKITSYILLLLLFVIALFPSCGLTAYADEATETVYTNVLDDLSTDENFTTDDYPEDLEDYSLSVIQIAESSDGELFVYVYQPSGQSIDLRASYINMAHYTGESSESEDLENTSLYTLTYLNSSETLYKYKVDEITLLTSSLRYYNITSIYRPAIDGVDETIAYEDQNISYVSYEVAQIWEAYSYNDSVLYSCYETEVITITDKYVGYCKYSSDYGILSAVDYDQRSHFVAFATDHDIDKLYEATVYYDYYSYYFNVVGTAYTESEDEGSEVVTLYADEYGETGVTGLFGYHKTFTFSRIQTIDEFIEGESDTDTIFFIIDQTTYSVASDEVSDIIGNMQYVLRFVETDYLVAAGADIASIRYTDISNVSILRLKFETDGVVYDLGVVDNMQTEGSNESNETYTEYDWADWLKNLVEWLMNNWQYILIGIACVIVLIICAPFIPSILSFIVQAVRWLFKGIWWLIQQIAKGIVWIFTSVKDAIDSLTK